MYNFKFYVFRHKIKAASFNAKSEDNIQISEVRKAPKLILSALKSLYIMWEGVLKFKLVLSHLLLLITFYYLLV